MGAIFICRWLRVDDLIASSAVFYWHGIKKNTYIQSKSNEEWRSVEIIIFFIPFTCEWLIGQRSFAITNIFVHLHTSGYLPAYNVTYNIFFTLYHVHTYKSTFTFSSRMWTYWLVLSFVLLVGGYLVSYYFNQCNFKT